MSKSDGAVNCLGQYGVANCLPIQAGMVVVCGRIVEIERTKSVYQLEDNSGRLEVVQWVEEGDRA